MSSLHSENYSTLKPLKISPEKSQILRCDTVVANERYYNACHPKDVTAGKKLFFT